MTTNTNIHLQMSCGNIFKKNCPKLRYSKNSEIQFTHWKVLLKIPNKTNWALEPVKSSVLFLITLIYISAAVVTVPHVWQSKCDSWVNFQHDLHVKANLLQWPHWLEMNWAISLSSRSKYWGRRGSCKIFKTIITIISRSPPFNFQRRMIEKMINFCSLSI